MDILSTTCPQVTVPTIEQSTIIQNYNTVNIQTKQNKGVDSHRTGSC